MYKSRFLNIGNFFYQCNLTATFPKKISKFYGFLNGANQAKDGTESCSTLLTYSVLFTIEVNTRAHQIMWTDKRWQSKLALIPFEQHENSGLSLVMP